MSSHSQFLGFCILSHLTTDSPPLYVFCPHFISSPDKTAILQCTTNPPSLYILSSASFNTLHTISSPYLVPFTHPAPLKPNLNNVSYIDADDSPDSDNLLAQPQPIFALSHRLLAFASSPPRPDSPSATQPRTHSRPPSGTFGIAQAELGHAALKVGGTVLSGMKSLGGMAYSAAKSRVGHDQGGGGAAAALLPGSSPSASGGLTNLFFSRSAPATSGGSHHARRASLSSNTPQMPSEPVFTATHGVSPHPPKLSSSDSHITIIDLGPLLSPHPSHPSLVSEFAASKRQAISNIAFMKDGNSLIVSAEDGRVARVFQVKPRPAVYSPATQAVAAEPWHMYNLRRGRTPAVVEGITSSDDGRWIALGTRKRTVHVFAVNPYGGKPDNKSHLEGRVQNVSELVSSQIPAAIMITSTEHAITN